MTKQRTMRPEFVPPMAAALVDELPAGDEWLDEAKFDGSRAIAVKDGKTFVFFPGKGTTCRKTIRELPQPWGLRAQSAAIDGEIVAFDVNGRPSFQQLQHRAATGVATQYFAFDLLHLNGADLTVAPLHEQRRRLAALLHGSNVEFSEELTGTPDQVVQAVAQVGLEGVVAKRRDSRYEPGKRSGLWQKFKIQQRQEFVIGGCKPEHRNFQSLVVGYDEGKHLRFAGRVRAGFTEWTRDGHLRHSVFVAVRTDKSPTEVARELNRRVNADHR